MSQNSQEALNPFSNNPPSVCQVSFKLETCLSDTICWTMIFVISKLVGFSLLHNHQSWDPRQGVKPCHETHKKC
jgi:hypothetical protein